MAAPGLRIIAVALALTLGGCRDGASADLAATERARQSGQSVRLEDGRTLFVRCAGRGSPTVLLESGYGATSQAWFAVQPALSRTILSRNAIRFFSRIIASCTGACILSVFIFSIP